jgi:hypothetical protein
MAAWPVGQVRWSRRKPGFVRLLALGVLAILVSGCVSGSTEDSSLSKDARFGEAEVPPAKGLILVGIRVVREPSSTGLFGGKVELDPLYVLQFSRLVDGRVARPLPEAQICGPGRIAFGNAFDPCIPQIVRYRLLAVPPGRYTLNNFYFRTQHTMDVTSFVTRHKGPRMGFSSYELGEPASHPERSFTVGAGEIVYIGDLSFDADGLPARIAIGRNDGAARAALAAYPDVHGPIVFRSALGPLPGLGPPTVAPTLGLPPLE